MGGAGEGEEEEFPDGDLRRVGGSGRRIEEVCRSRVEEED